MTRGGAVFLILLRLAIGWHFLFEGIQKVQSRLVGETATGKPFTSAAYFREAPGPAGGMWRWANGDPDSEALARLVPRIPAEKADPANDMPHTRMPPGLRKDWKTLSKRYADHYGIDPGMVDVDEQGVARDGAALMAQFGNEAVRWLEWQPDPILEEVRARFGKLDGIDLTLLGEREKVAYQSFIDNTTEQKRTYPTGEVKRRMSMAERVAEYRDKVDEVRDLSGRKAWRFGKDVEKGRLLAAKAELGRIRSALLADMDRTQTAAFMRALNNLVARSVAVPVGQLSKEAKLPLAEAMNKDLAVLTPAQAATLTIKPIDVQAIREQAGRLASEVDAQAKAATNSASGRLRVLSLQLRASLDELPDVGPLPPPEPDRFLWWMDTLTAWGLTVVGACLLVGFLTRINCWLAALFLLMTYLAVPALPWFPVVGPSEGNYVFVNKNVVEMLALCALGCLPTGRWFGADGLLRSLWLWMTGGVDDDADNLTP